MQDEKQDEKSGIFGLLQQDLLLTHIPSNRLSITVQFPVDSAHRRVCMSVISKSLPGFLIVEQRYTVSSLILKSNELALARLLIRF